MPTPDPVAATSKWRQAITAYLQRLPRSELAGVSTISKALGWDGVTYGWRDPIWKAVKAELDAMERDGLIVYRSHRGWRLIDRG